MEARIIRNPKDHQASLREVAALALRDPKPGTQEGDRLEHLSILVEHYEKNHFPIDLPDPIAAIRFRMEQQGLRPGDLVPYIGSRGRVSEILSKKRRLSLAMIRSLHEGLGISAAVLIGSTKPSKRRGRGKKPNRN